MPDASWFLFVVASLVLIATPGPVGLIAGWLSGWLRARPAALTGLYRSSGAVLLLLGVKLAFERRA